MKLSGELDYRIRYDVEHDLFHAQNVFNDEYIPPTFIEYVQKLEKENKVLAQNLEDSEIINKALEKENAELKEELKDANKKVVHLACNQNKDLKRKINKAKELISEYINILKGDTKNWKKTQEKAEQFIKDSEVEK